MKQQKNLHNQNHAKHSHICVLGSANVDYFVYLPHIPYVGQTIQAQKVMTANGGKGANQAVAVSRLAGKSTFAGQVGKDDEKNQLQRQMLQSGVQLMWREKENCSTGKAFIYVDAKGQNCIVIVGGANIQYKRLDELPKEFKLAIQSNKVLLLQKQIPIQINLLAASYAKSKGKLVILDCGGRDDPIPQQLINYLDYLSPNQTELLRIDPTIDFNNLVSQIRSKVLSKHKGLKILLKLGSKGAAIVTQNQYYHQDVVTKLNPQILKDYSIVDTVGAGDCFTGAFAVKCHQLNWQNSCNDEQNYRQSIIFANSSAFLCITKKGAMPSMPTRQEVQKFIQTYNLRPQKQVKQ